MNLSINWQILQYFSLAQSSSKSDNSPVFTSMGFRVRLASFLVISVALSSCATQRIYTSDGSVAMNADYEKSQAFWLSGFGGFAELNAQQICKDKTVERVETFWSFTDGFFNVMTIGIYTPRTVRVYCAETVYKKKELEEVARNAATAATKQTLDRTLDKAVDRAVNDAVKKVKIPQPKIPDPCDIHTVCPKPKE